VECEEDPMTHASPRKVPTAFLRKNSPAVSSDGGCLQKFDRPSRLLPARLPGDANRAIQMLPKIPEEGIIP
jgi:hypothetical protein